MSKWQYHHLGIPNTIPREKEHYFEKFKMYHTNFDDNPYGIEWLRFEEGCDFPPLVKTSPHIAFKVDNLEEAITLPQTNILKSITKKIIFFIICS